MLMTNNNFLKNKTITHNTLYSAIKNSAIDLSNPSETAKQI